MATKLKMDREIQIFIIGILIGMLAAGLTYGGVKLVKFITRPDVPEIVLPENTVRAAIPETIRFSTSTGELMDIKFIDGITIEEKNTIQAKIYENSFSSTEEVSELMIYLTKINLIDTIVFSETLRIAIKTMARTNRERVEKIAVSEMVNEIAFSDLQTARAIIAKEGYESMARRDANSNLIKELEQEKDIAELRTEIDIFNTNNGDK